MKLHKSKITGIVWKQVGEFTYECVEVGDTARIIGDRITVHPSDDLVTGRNFTTFIPFKEYYEATNK